MKFIMSGDPDLSNAILNCWSAISKSGAISSCYPRPLLRN